MDYEQTLDYLYSRLPMFTRVGAIAFKKDLHNTIALCEYLDNPQNRFKSIHVGGTNGKGSTSHMLASILQEAGYKTGLYTSPHLVDFRERIRINGEMISKEFVIDFTEQTQLILDDISPSFFEVTVAMAFSYFAKNSVDIAIIEVGLGGRLDSTNIITPELSVITNISLDHTYLLGNTLKEIAFEKAGIIKKKVPVIIGEFDMETADVFKEKAIISNAVIRFADQVLNISQVKFDTDMLSLSVYRGSKLIYENLEMDLTGSYQLKNVLSVLEAVEVLKKIGYELRDSHVYSGLKNVKKLTGLKGRWYILDHNPLIVCDTGHNESGIKEVVNNLLRLKYKQLHIVIGMVKDKDIASVLAKLPIHATYYFCSPNLERALSADELRSQAAVLKLVGKSFLTVTEAFSEAKKNASKDDVIFVGGSTFVVAEVL
ncbi:bifunctional folylpolyglutamate synthase/dihydrofolate synthase [Pedobacter sp. JCM 36344]|uniref:bifunctional folylpolyglutamate synthase/dihydrofolate synthase n=1 Tax=Pedobacter sp. JCM 36344 TaxID=3374280 RepID=UPI00397A1C76